MGRMRLAKSAEHMKSSPVWRFISLKNVLMVAFFKLSVTLVFTTVCCWVCALSNEDENQQGATLRASAIPMAGM